MHHSASLALATAFALAFSAQAQTPGSTPLAPAAPTLVYSNVHSDESISAQMPLEFRLGAPLSALQGQVTLLVNGNDIGSFLQTSDAMHYVLEPAQFALPVGALVIELVFEPAGGGEPVTLLSAPVMLRADADAPAEVVGAAIPPDQTALIAVNGNLGEPAGGQVGSVPTPAGPALKGQIQAAANSTSGTANGNGGGVVTRELALQLGLRYENEKDGHRLAIGSNFVGNSQEAKALAYSAAGRNAPKFDLNDYLAEFQTASARLSLGTASVAGNPLLGQSFDNRGISGAYRWNNGVDIALTSQSATALVGANPLIGFGDVQRRLTAVTVGWEAMVDQPGVLRVEATGLSGSIDRGQGAAGSASAPPAPGSGASPASERSHGLGLRVQWSPLNSIYRLEAAYARSTSTQPNPLGGEQVEQARAAYFADGTVRVLDVAADAGRIARRLVLHLRHEFADTGFRSIAGGMAGDIRRTLLGAEGLYGPLQGQFNHSFGRNNVSGLAGLPVLETVTDTLSLALPLSQLMANPAQPAPPQPQDAATATALALTPPGPAGSWWPTLQLGLQYNKQRPVQLPDSVPASLVPAATSTNATINAQWTRNAWTWSGGLTAGLRENQQPGSESQGQRARGVQFQLQWQARADLMASAGLRRSRAIATDTGIAQIQTGTDLGLTWQLAGGWSLNGQYSTNGDRDSIYSQDNAGRNLQLQASKSWTLPFGPNHMVPLQLALRVQQQMDRSNTLLNGTASQNSQRSRLVGMTLTATL